MMYTNNIDDKKIKEEKKNTVRWITEIGSCMFCIADRYKLGTTGVSNTGVIERVGEQWI